MGLLHRDIPTFASIFSGCGGFDLGFIEAGFQCRLAIDCDKDAAVNHSMNIGSPVICEDLQHLPVDELLCRGAFDVLLAGPPCQGFSTMGKRMVNDPRNNLLLLAGVIASRTRPSIVVIENVKGVVSGFNEHYWHHLQAILRSSGYHTCELTCKAVEMGVPQTRTRMIMLAWPSGIEVRLKLPKTYGGVLRDAITNINGAKNHQKTMLSEDSTIGKIAKRLGPGQKLCNVRGGERSVRTWDIPEVFGKTNSKERMTLETITQLRRRNRVRAFGDADPLPLDVLVRELDSSVVVTLASLSKKGYVRVIDGSYDICHTFNGKPKRLCFEQPSPTVDTRFGDPRCFLHPSENRGFTIREAARIQGFPDSYHFAGNERKLHELIGNAVPPPVAALLADVVLKSILV